MKTLITGGAGFIGSNFCEYVVDKYPGDDFVCLDALTYAGNINYLKNCLDKENFKFVRGNICDKNLVEKLFEEEKFDTIINFAAESHVENSIVDSTMFIESNIRGVQVLLEVARKYNVKRFHQISTDEVYGDLDYDDKSAFNEASLLRPSNPYSASKASADLLVLSYHRTYNLNVSISRSSNNYGLNQHHEKLIPKIVKLALENNKVPVHGNGFNTRDWLYVKDYCKAIDLIVRYGKNGEIYNVSAHNEIRNLDMIKLILKKLNKDESLLEFVQDRPGNDKRYPLDTTKFDNEFEDFVKSDFDNAINETIDFYIRKSAE